MGDATIGVVTENRPRWFGWWKFSRQTVAVHPHRRPLMLRQEIIQMDPAEQIILRPGLRPIRARKIQWWKEPEFTKRRRDPPQIPHLLVEIALDDGKTVIGRSKAPTRKAPLVAANDAAR